MDPPGWTKAAPCRKDTSIDAKKPSKVREIRTFVKSFTERRGTSADELVSEVKPLPPRTLTRELGSWLQPPRNEREGKGVAMFHYLHERDVSPSSPSSAERWARLEAKSDAMVDDVLASSGAANTNAAGSAALRRWQLAAFAIVVLWAFLWVAARVIASIPPAPPETNSLRDHVATSSESPRFWGPFRP